MLARTAVGQSLRLFGSIEHEVMEDVVLNKAIDSSSLQYAIIAGPRTENGPERLVIEYANEESLSDLIAAPSILAAGFASREDALASSRTFTAGGVTEKYRQTLDLGKRRYEMSSTLRRVTRFLTTSYSEAAIAAAVLFSSRRLVSTIIRMALGCSA